jgi:hypothetical protein
VIELARAYRKTLPKRSVQNKTTSAFVESPATHPLAGIVGVTTIRERARKLFQHSPDSPARFIDALCRLTDNLFGGRFWNYQPIDLRYHDFLHTLQASQVYLDLAAAAQNNLPPDKCPTPRELQLGFAAILLHDTGYLKARGDDEGTGAKYTHSHVLRSCALAASVLPDLECQPSEIDNVLGAIRSTGLQGNPTDSEFSSETARLIACMVATADYIGQMAAPEYPGKLANLFAEFEEADDYVGTPKESRIFKSPAALIAATPGFWTGYVLPRLDNDFAGVYRLLATPNPDGPNRYLTAIECNIGIIPARAATSKPITLA